MLCPVELIRITQLPSITTYLESDPVLGPATHRILTSHRWNINSAQANLPEMAGSPGIHVPYGEEIANRRAMRTGG